MEQANEGVFEQCNINQFTYQKIMQPRSTSSVLFRHDDKSINKAFVFSDGGYVHLSVLPSELKKPSGRDLRSLFQRSSSGKTKTTQPQWVQDAQQKIQNPKKAGWKFHFSIEQNTDNVEKAWNALVPILLKHKVGDSKIVRPENPQVANKVITVYTFSGGPIDSWDSFLKDAEIALRQSGVVPGNQIYEDRIKGSDYIYYRNDADQNGEYVDDSYNFLYKVVDQIPLSELKMSELATELKQSKGVVGCIIKLKGQDACCLHVQASNDWVSQEFNVNELKDIQHQDEHQRVTLSPMTNRQAYIKLVVPQLNQTIPSTNNVAKAPDLFKSIDMTKLLEESMTQSRNL